MRPDDLLTGALREFKEETGLTAAGPFVALKPVRQKSGKTVHGFAFEADLDLTNFSSNMFEMEWPPRSGKRKQFPEIDRIGWFGADDGDEKDHRLSAAVPGRAAGEARWSARAESSAAADAHGLCPNLCMTAVTRYARTSCRWNDDVADHVEQDRAGDQADDLRPGLQDALVRAAAATAMRPWNCASSVVIDCASGLSIATTASP